MCTTFLNFQVPIRLFTYPCYNFSLLNLDLVGNTRFISIKFKKKTWKLNSNFLVLVLLMFLKNLYSSMPLKNIYCRLRMSTKIIVTYVKIWWWINLYRSELYVIEIYLPTLTVSLYTHSISTKNSAQFINIFPTVTDRVKGRYENISAT